MKYTLFAKHPMSDHFVGVYHNYFLYNIHIAIKEIPNNWKFYIWDNKENKEISMDNI